MHKDDFIAHMDSLVKHLTPHVSTADIGDVGKKGAHSPANAVRGDGFGVDNKLEEEKHQNPKAVSDDESKKNDDEYECESMYFARYLHS